MKYFTWYEQKGLWDGLRCDKWDSEGCVLHAWQCSFCKLQWSNTYANAKGEWNPAWDKDDKISRLWHFRVKNDNVHRISPPHIQSRRAMRWRRVWGGRTIRERYTDWKRWIFKDLFFAMSECRIEKSCSINGHRWQKGCRSWLFENQIKSAVTC